MTPEELRRQAAGLQRHVWRNIDPRKFVVGRKMVCKITMMAVQQWPVRSERAYDPATGSFKLTDSPDSQQDLRDYIFAQMRGHRGYDRKYGSIWAIILSAVIAQAVQALVKWWLERRENQDIMAYMRTFRGKDGQECL